MVIYKSNAVIEAGYQLSLNEQRVILAAIGLVDPRKNLLVTDRFELSAKDFCVLFDVSEKNAYKALIDVAERLFSRYVVIQNPDSDWDKLKTHWISSVRYSKYDGQIALSFAPDIIPYLSQLKGSFTRYELKHIGNMTSTYGVRLYELLMQWKNKGSREIEIAWLKKQFQIEGKYSSIKDLKKYVIEPAIKDINTHSNLTASWEQRKTGRVVTHLIFTFTEKEQSLEQIYAELDAELDAEYKRAERDITDELQGNFKLSENDYDALGYELMSASTLAHTTQEPDNKPPKTDITITLTDEQLKCFEWAKNHDHWKKYTRNKKSFLTCFNKIMEGGLKDQWLATLTVTPKKEKTVYGVPLSEIEKHARIGESQEQAAGRINRDKVIKKPSPQTQKPAASVSELLKNGFKKPQPVTPAVQTAENEAHRIFVINAYINKNGKEKYLADFKKDGFVSITGIGGVIIEADLKLAGLFD